MSPAPDTLKPAVARSLDTWHRMVAQRDLGALASIVHPEAVFRSPMAHAAYSPAPALILALQTVVKVFENFRYHRQFASADGLNAVLEFSADVGDKQVKGVDLIRFDEAGRIVEFEVMVRPMSGLQALGAEMGQRLGGQLPAYKAKA